MVRLDLGMIACLFHPHLRVPGQQLRQGASVIRGQVLDNDGPDASIGRGVLEKILQRLQAARGRSQRGDYKSVWDLH